MKAKRYNLKIVEMDSNDVVYEEELQLLTGKGCVLVTNPPNGMISNIEDAIEDNLRGSA